MPVSFVSYYCDRSFVAIRWSIYKDVVSSLVLYVFCFDQLDVWVLCMLQEVCDLVVV